MSLLFCLLPSYLIQNKKKKKQHPQRRCSAPPSPSMFHQHVFSYARTSNTGHKRTWQVLTLNAILRGPCWFSRSIRGSLHTRIRGTPTTSAAKVASLRIFQMSTGQTRKRLRGVANLILRHKLQPSDVFPSCAEKTRLRISLWE